MKYIKSFGIFITLSALLVSMLFSGGVVSAIDVTPEQFDGVLYPLYEDSACTGAICECRGPVLSGDSVEEQVWNFLVTNMGLTSIQAAAVMGNIEAESSFKTTALNPTSGAYGLIQWYRGRKTGLENYARDQGKDVSDLGIQLEYMKIELEGAYKESVLDPLKATDDLREATRIWLEHFEIPCTPGSAECAEELLSNRLPKAQNWLTQFGSGTPNPSSGSGSGCAVSLDGCPTEPVSRTEVISVRGILVHPCISEEVERILSLAAAENLDMGGGGWRDQSAQIELRKKHGCGGDKIYDSSCPGSPPTAVPGDSNHQKGTAVDFTCNGVAIPSRSSPCFIFLSDNTSLINLDSEPWHWSVDGF